MPDISMCKTECGQHKSCYRFIAKPNDYWQAYMSDPRSKPKTSSKLTAAGLRDMQDTITCKYYVMASEAEISMYKKMKNKGSNS